MSKKYEYKGYIYSDDENGIPEEDYGGCLYELLLELEYVDKAEEKVRYYSPESDEIYYEYEDLIDAICDEVDDE